MAHIKLVKGDSRTVITASITSDGGPENLSNSAVTLKVRQADSITPLFTVPGDLLPGYVDADGNVNTSVFTALGSGGRVQFQFPVGSLNIDAGNYEAEIEIVYAAGGSQTVYDLVKLLVRE